MDPINKKYMVQLDELKKKLGGKGDLEGAQKVQKEIEAVAGKTETVDINVKNLIGKWDVKHVGYQGIWIFNEDGTVSGNDGRIGTWELKKDIIAIHWKAGWEDELVLPIKLSGTKGNSRELGPGSISLKKADDIGEPKNRRK